jgi:predicted RNA binding protein YcfA (HicA-like mRNA interferase family)
VSNRLPQLKAKDIVWVASKLGFTFDRQSGSHAIYYRESDRRRVVVPVHPGKEIKRKTLFGIITDMGIQIEDLRESLK